MDLLIQVHHKDAKEDHGEDHLADGHSGVAPIQRRSIADDDDETDELRVIGGKEGRGGGKNNEKRIFILKISRAA